MKDHNLRTFIQLVAVGPDGAIGKDGKIPWHLPNDLKSFKAQTQGHTVIMGRKTYESIGRPLPYRVNWVLSQNKEVLPSHTYRTLNSVRVAVTMAQEENPAREFFIIGGSRLYDESLAYTKEVRLTRVHGHFFGCDAFYPCDLKAAGFKLISISPQDKAHSFEVWRHESCLSALDTPLT